MRKWRSFAAWALAAALFVGVACAAQLGLRGEAETEIRLDAAGSVASGAGVEIDGDVVTVRAAGVYRVTGSLPQGQLRVKVDKDSRVTLILAGAEIANATEPALLVENADLVTLRLAEGAANRLRSGAPVEIRADAADADASGGALHAKDDLTIEGPGSLAVEGYLNNGIHCSNRLTISGGEIAVEAANNGVKGKDGVIVSGGNLRIRSGGDGIDADSEDGAGYGTIELAGGSVHIESFGDGAQAATELRVSGGAIDINSGGGSAAAEPKPAEDFGRRGENWDRDEEDDGPSCKGLKAGTLLSVSGGDVTIDAADDALHSDGELLLRGGSLRLASGDDGAHADERLAVSGGSLIISNSYEGLEANQLEISGGDIDLTATDDGVNANGGAQFGRGFGMGGPRFGGGGFGQRPDGGKFGGSAPGGGAPEPRGNFPPDAPGAAPNSDDAPMPALRITGGKLRVNAEGDGLDSNGDLRIEGGEVIVDGPSRSGNGALDSGSEGGGACEISGGTVLAVGASGMAESFDESSEQPSFRCDFDETISAGSEIRVTGPDGEALLAHTAAKDFSSVVFSCPALEIGQTYALSAGGRRVEIALDSASVESGVRSRWGR